MDGVCIVSGAPISSNACKAGNNIYESGYED